MRIALTTEVFLPKIDGITNRLRNTLECLVEEGHDVLLLAPETAVAQFPGVRVVRIPGLTFPPYPELRMCAPDPRISWELLRFRPDVVHAVSPVTLGIWGIVTARALGLPVVASYHTDFPRYVKGYGLAWAEPAVWPLIRWVHNAAHRNLTPSQFTKREMERHGVRNVGIWRGGVDTELFHPKRRSREMRERLSGGEPDAPILLFVGRLAPEKRVDTLGWVLDALPEARLALVGDGPGRPQLERVFADNAVEFTGFLRGEELATAFASADVFVMPSTTETLGFVILEAMSAGCSVVAAHAGGIPDLVQHGENGLLYDPERQDEAVAAVRSLIENPSQRQCFGEQGRKNALAGGWPAETGKLVEDYRRTIQIQRQQSLLGKIRHAFAL